MAEYTFTVYELQQANFDFGLNDYPIFEESYRVVLNNAILEHYKFKEIAYSNPYLWRDRLRNRLSIIMRNKYNALYKAKKIEFNPIYNVEMHETYTHEINNKGTGTNTTEQNTTNKAITDGTVIDTSNGTTDNLAFSSAFPSEPILEGDLTSPLYADNANKQKGTTTGTNTTNDDTTITTTDTGTVTNNNSTNGNMKETYTKFTEGSSAGLPFSRAMQQLKDYLDDFQLDQQVIDALKDLFYSVW
jgi:DNA replication protein DnaD